MAKNVSSGPEPSPAAQGLDEVAKTMMATSGPDDDRTGTHAALDQVELQYLEEQSRGRDPVNELELNLDLSSDS